MGYRNDQFFNWEASGESSTGHAYTESQGLAGETAPPRKRRSYYHPGADNPRFIYPDREVRTHKRDGNGNIVEDVKLLSRGYMRSIPVREGDPVYKCQFQFNPQNLTFSVGMSETLLNVFQQDPGQFAQPLAGNTDLAVTLIFDRTMEINNGPPVVSSTAYPGAGSELNTTNPWVKSGPSEVGVLRDIGTLYNVIGQGVAEGDASARLEELKQTIKSEALAADDSDGADQVSLAYSNLEELMNANVGNYGILIPRPVRIMFSSLYMIEGYVTSTTVTFNKFNSAFVPIQAMVNLTIKAQHVGFAKEKTFLTYALEESRKAELRAEEEERAATLQTYDLVKSDLTTWELGLFQAGSPQGSLLYGSLDGVSMAHFDETDAGYVVAYHVLRAKSASGSLDGVKSLLQSGGTVELKFSLNVFTDMVDRHPERGREMQSPRVSQSASVHLSTVADLERFYEAAPFPGHYFSSSVANAQFFTPVTEYGGNCRFAWTVDVLISHEGAQLRGSSKYTDDNLGDAQFWGEDIQASTSVSWTALGDPVSNLPTIDAGSVAEAGQPSEVD